MRDIFNQELKQLGSDLETMARQVATAIERAAESLGNGDIIVALRMAQTLERQGDLARHVAAIARGRYPEPPVPEPVMGLILQMADAAVRAGADVARLIATHDLELAAQIQRGDSALDALHRQSFQMILDPANDLSRQQVVDAVLMGRFLERFGDHSTSVARRMAYLVSGGAPG